MFVLAIFIGFIINAIGYLPPGNINLSVAQIAINKGKRQAYYFILAFSIVEVFFTFGMMRLARWMSSDLSLNSIVGSIKLSTLIDLLMFLIFISIGSITWINRDKLPAEKPKRKESKRGSILHGLLLGVVNPVQIPFWIFFGNFVILHNWIETDYLSLTLFSLGSGLGSAAALYAYVHFARYIQEKFALSHAIMNKSIAIFLFVLAAYLILKNLLVLG